MNFESYLSRSSLPFHFQRNLVECTLYINECLCHHGVWRTVVTQQTFYLCVWIEMDFFKWKVMNSVNIISFFMSITNFSLVFLSETSWNFSVLWLVWISPAGRMLIGKTFRQNYDFDLKNQFETCKIIIVSISNLNYELMQTDIVRNIQSQSDYWLLLLFYISIISIFKLNAFERWRFVCAIASIHLVLRRGLLYSLSLLFLLFSHSIYLFTIVFDHGELGVKAV